MRWPFMLRATHEAYMDMAKANIQMLLDNWRETQESRKALQDRHDAFVATLAERALPPAKPAPLPPQPPKVKDAAEVAADTAALFDPRRRRYLDQFVRQRRAEGVAAEDIAQEILHPLQTGDGTWEMPE